MPDLACKAILTKSGLTARVDRLEDLGLVERHPDPDNRRATRVVLTSKGREVFLDAATVHPSSINARFSDLITETEARTITGALERVWRVAEWTVRSTPDPVERTANSRTLRPLGTARPVLLLPDRCSMLQLVDHEAGSLERRIPMRCRHGNDNRRLAQENRSRSMIDRYCLHCPSGSRFVHDLGNHPLDLVLIHLVLEVCDSGPVLRVVPHRADEHDGRTGRRGSHKAM
jgi:hypothetical protein